MSTQGDTRDQSASVDMLTPENRGKARTFLEMYADTISEIQAGDPDVAYADTADSAEFLDNILGSLPEYQALLSERSAASRKAMQGASPAEKEQGLTEALAWIEKVKALVQEK